MVKDDRPFDVVMPVIGNIQVRFVEQPLEGLLALLDRLLAQVAAIDFDQVERTERRGVTTTVVADELEYGKALTVADDGLSIDQTRAHRQCRDGGRNQREAIRKVPPVPTDKSYFGTITASQYSKAVMLDLMNPIGAGRRSFRSPGQTWLDITGMCANTRTKQRQAAVHAITECEHQSGEKTPSVLSHRDRRLEAKRGDRAWSHIIMPIGGNDASMDLAKHRQGVQIKRVGPSSPKR